MKLRSDPDAGGSGGEQTEQPWYAELFPQAAHADLERFKKPEDLVKSYRTLRQDLSDRPAKGSIVVPKDDSSEEAKIAFRQAMGIPAKPEEYHLEGQKFGGTVPGESSVDTEMLGKIQKVAHDTNMTQQQFTALVKEYSALVTGRQEQTRQSEMQAQIEADAYLRAHFGDNLDGEKAKLSTAMRNLMGGNDAGWMQELFDIQVPSPTGKMGPLSQNGHFLRFMFALQAMTAGDRFADQTRRPAGANGGGKHPDEITAADLTDAELNNIYGDFMDRRPS